MAEVNKVSGKMQLDTEGGLMRATFEMVVETGATGLGNVEAAFSFTGESGATKAGLVIVEAAGGFAGEIGATKAGLGNGEASRSYTGEIRFNKALPLNKEAAGGSSGEIGFTMTVMGNKEAACGSTGEIGVTKAGLGKEEEAGGSTGEIVVSKAGIRNKEVAGSSTTKAVLRSKEAAGSSTTEAGRSTGENGSISEIGITKAASGSTREIGITKAELRDVVWTSMVTEESWINYVILYTPDQERLAPKQDRKAEPMEALVTKERVPDIFIDILTKRRPFKKLLPMTDTCSSLLSKRSPVLHELYQKDMVRINCCVDLHTDVLRQHKEKGFAEVGVDFTGGVKMIFVLP